MKLALYAQWDIRYLTARAVRKRRAIRGLRYSQVKLTLVIRSLRSAMLFLFLFLISSKLWLINYDLISSKYEILINNYYDIKGKYSDVQKCQHYLFRLQKTAVGSLIFIVILKIYMYIYAYLNIQICEYIKFQICKFKYLHIFEYLDKLIHKQSTHQEDKKQFFFSYL